MSLLPPSSPPSSHSSSYVGEWEYDVFLCFRGDTRFGFTSHLLNALSNKQIRTFIDNKLEKTESIDKLISILQRSALSVVLYSEKFAYSIWCLEEVVTIARRMAEFGHRVLPVFYRVVPSDVTDDSRIERLLDMDTLDDTRIIGLWGMSGVGKTTLAEACYKRIISSNKGIKYCFIGSISEKCGKWHGVEGIVNELYSRLLSENCIDRPDLDISYRRGRLTRLRVFIVLDDVETPSQLEQILLGDVIMNPAELFARGSRIIVTTRDKRVLDYAKAMIYNVAGLNGIESIELFSLRAFRQHQPPHDWVDLSRLAASYCVGNPLALTILGGTLFGQDQHYWRSFLSELKLIQNLSVHDILRRSYDKIGAEEKKVFLDVACLLCEISRSQLIAYMATMYPSAYTKVKDLIDRSLLTCVSVEIGEKIVVHDLLKEMAWNIVNEEPKLHKRSRLVDADDIHKLLTTREPQLVNLMVLNLSYCRNLIAIPNISCSSNLEELRLRECESLVESLQFDDCPQLDQTLPAKLVQISSLMPPWVQSISVKVELPLLKDSDQPMIKAIAFGVVIFPQPDYHHRRMGCECEVGNTTVASWSFNIWVSGINESLSKKLWLAFDNDLSGNSRCEGKGDEAWYLKYAGLSVSFKFRILDKVKIKACGVSLLY
ncbi:Disease resistance protein RUN1 [Linum perenne]